MLLSCCNQDITSAILYLQLKSGVLMKFIGGSKLKTGGSIILVPVNYIIPNPNQPRKIFNKTELDGLASSIKHNGIIQPLVIRRNTDETYELISGERRLRAAISVGLETVPCIVMSACDEQSALYSIIENIQRDNLNFFEEAEAISKLSTVYNLSQQEIANKLGKSQSSLSNKCRLLKLSSELRSIIIENSLSERHARALLKLNGDVERLKAVLYIIEKKLNVSETDKYIENLINPITSKTEPKIKKLRDIKIFINTINHAVDTMRKAGIKAVSAEHETEDYYEYVVRIPKMTTSPVNIADYSGNAV